MRQTIFNVGDITVIQDCYNASPESMKASIDVLRSVAARKQGGRMTALLGDMYEHGRAEFRLEEGIKYFINVGSVGQPRDRDNRACYAVYDTDTRTVTIKRVPYDIEAAQQAILAVGLPEYLAERLANGC